MGESGREWGERGGLRDKYTHIWKGSREMSQRVRGRETERQRGERRRVHKTETEARKMKAAVQLIQVKGFRLHPLPHPPCAQGHHCMFHWW